MLLFKPKQYETSISIYFYNYQFNKYITIKYNIRVYMLAFKYANNSIIQLLKNKGKRQSVIYMLSIYLHCINTLST